MTFGDELKRLAEVKGYNTQQQLADASGVSQQMIARLYLNQRPNVSAVILGKLSKALGVTCDHLMPFLSDADETPATKPKRKPKK